MIYYAARMADDAGDPFTIKAEDGTVAMTDLEDGLQPEERCANLLFTPTQAMYLAAHLIRAATVAYAQETYASR